MVLDSKRMEMVKIMLLLFFLIKQNQDAAGHEITNHRYNECHHYFEARQYIVQGKVYEGIQVH